MINKDKNIRVVELFAGVGGFRVGLEKSSEKFNTVWANQWEPSKNTQHAYDCYVSHFGKTKNHVNADISVVKNDVPQHDLLVGGFPCQDYSVAQSGAKGIEGKKGVLWWEIRDIIEKNKPNYVLLENVDRLIKSPTTQRGRDFGVILRCLNDMGYAVEWRVINAAEYGFAQRRRRIFIFAYKNSTKIYKSLNKKYMRHNYTALNKWLKEDGFYAAPFPVINQENRKKCSQSDISDNVYSTLQELSDNYKTLFYNSGIMIKGVVYTEEVQAVEQNPITLRNIRHKKEVEEKYFLSEDTEKWKYLKGAKKIPRIKPNGEPYIFSEGNMCFPDDLDKPSRTMLTSESSVNRSSHVIEDAISGKLRLLTPVECERLNGFDDEWTNTGMPHRFRYFTMGNALVVPIIEKIGTRILSLDN